MGKKDYIEIKGKGDKLEEFYSAFLEGMKGAKVRKRRLPYHPNEEAITFTSLHLTKITFHAVNDDGDLYYNIYTESGILRYWKVVVILAIPALFSIPFFLWWNAIIGYILIAPIIIWLNYGWMLKFIEEPENSQVLVALVTAEKAITHV